jgi:hypothetical protein
LGLVDAHGTAHDGQPWTMPVAECFWIEDGKVTDIRPYYWDLVELRHIAGLAQTATPASEQPPVTAARAARCQKPDSPEQTPKMTSPGQAAPGFLRDRTLAPPQARRR